MPAPGCPRRRAECRALERRGEETASFSWQMRLYCHAGEMEEAVVKPLVLSFGASILAAGVVILAQAPPASVAIRAARLFDGRTDTAIADAVVVVQGTRITAAGSRLAIPAGAQVIDLGDATILPGFIDAHTHVTGESSDDWNADAVAGLRRNVAEAALHGAEFARRTLMAGFTTVRDVGAGDYVDVGLRNAIASGVAVGPRMLVSVHALGARGGHCDNTGFPYQ